MSKNILQRIAVLFLIVALVVVPALALFASESGSEYAYDVPRMLGMEGAGEIEVARLDGPPSTETSAPIFETHGKAVSFDKSLRDLPQTGPKDKKPAREMGTPPNMGPNGNGVDSVLQAPSISLAPAPAPLGSFKGLDLQTYGAGWPPDTHGDVGPNHYIQAVNTSIGIFDKASGTRLAAFTFDSFFLANDADPNDACSNLNYGDPFVLYDQVSGRWIITDFAFAGSGSTPPYYECIAVSKSADPVNGGWWLYTVVADTQSLNDYPKLGIWSDGIYMSANMFKRGRSYAGTKLWALNRADLISGAALRSVAFNVGNSYFSLLPANFEGTSVPPAGTPEYFMSDYGSNTSMKLWKFSVNWANPSASTLTGPTSFPVASFTRPSSSVPQKDGETVDTLGDRLMTWLQYSNVDGTESLWVSRTVVSGSSTGVRWMEVRNMKTTPSVYQQGTYAPDSNYRWMPSLAVNKSGDMAIGYSESSSSMFPAISYAGRLSTDPLGTLEQTEQTMIAGTSSQSSGYNRWGDYASMSVDPDDDCTFWFTTEYYEATSNSAPVTNWPGGNWQTRIGSFRLADCGTPTTGTLKGKVTDILTGFNISNATVTIADGGNTTTDASGLYQFTNVTKNLYSVTASATGYVSSTADQVQVTGGTTIQNFALTADGSTTGTIHVEALDGTPTVRRNNWNATVTITVYDNSEKAVGSVTVYFDNGLSCGTDSTGQCSVTTSNFKNNITSVTLTVTDLTRTGYTYNSAANENGDSITVKK